jgi:predicted DNA binding CopG/RHH family protein
MKKEREIPRFKNEEEERKFWVSHDSTDYINWSKAGRVKFPELKPSEKAISIRMPQFLIEELKILSNKRGLPYQSLLKEFLAERVEKELAAR